MAMALPDSQKTDSQPNSEHSQEVEQIAYGQLVSMQPCFDSVDKPEITLGRSPDCDVVVSRGGKSSNYINISCVHFKITHFVNELVVCLTDLSKNGTYVNSKLIGKGNEVFLKHNDQICIGTTDYEVFTFKSFNRFAKSFLPLGLMKRYEFERPLGSGASGDVVLVRERVSCKPYAIKKINKVRLNDPHSINNQNRIKNEMNIMRSVSHPYIISTKEIVDTDEAVFIVLEYMAGGELTNLLSTGPLPENVVKLLFYQIVLGLRHLHLLNITHRDLKPSNILLQSEKSITVAKIADFGLSKIIGSSSELDTWCGTPSYIAPEIIDYQCGPYTKQVDIWSLGVILYHMLSGELPFRGKGKHPIQVLKLIVSEKYNITSIVWNSVSYSAKDLLQHMLIVNPKKRYTIEEVVNHPWLSQDLCMQQQARNILITRTNLPQQCCDEPPHKKLKID
ncbi:hypothetical protein FQR65_LT08650 [Abscondita terminalis]|nr:hypothetical protein FQR65_LT08650 [Abscondita terminalis]